MIRGPYHKPSIIPDEPPAELTNYYRAGADLVEMCSETLPETGRLLHEALLRGDRERVDFYCLVLEGCSREPHPALLAFRAAMRARDVWSAQARQRGTVGV